jgi:hypothetical protein
MKIHKTVNEAVIRANHENGRKGKGPKTQEGKNNMSGNATKLGILARKFRFTSEHEKNAYKRLHAKVLRSIDPEDAFQLVLAEEFVMANIRRARALRFEQKVCEQQNPATELALNTIDDSELLSNGLSLTRLNPPWNCLELDIRAKKSRDDVTKRGPVSSGNGMGKELQIHAKFQDPLDKALRYDRVTAKDLYRALEVLCRLREKKKRKSKHSRDVPTPHIW